MENMKEFNEYIDMMRDEILTEYRSGNNDRDDWSDIVHEHADGSQYVIYYGMAWELVNMVRKYDYALFEDAQQGLYGLELECSEVNKAMSILAYEVIYQQLMLALNDSMEAED